MLDMPPSFEPKTVTIDLGTTVEWRNIGTSVHHATDDHEMAISAQDVASPNGTAVFDSGFLRPDGTFTHTFTKAGVYKYVCVVHEASGMKGEIIVTGDGNMKGGKTTRADEHNGKQIADSGKTYE